MQIPYEKLVLFQLLKKYPAFYWTRILTTIFSRETFVPILWQSVPPTVLWKSITMLPFYTGVQLVEALRHKPEGRGFDSR
jgi:hypothetical protein